MKIGVLVLRWLISVRTAKIKNFERDKNPLSLPPPNLSQSLKQFNLGTPHICKNIKNDTKVRENIRWTKSSFDQVILGISNLKKSWDEKYRGLKSGNSWKSQIPEKKLTTSIRGREKNPSPDPTFRKNGAPKIFKFNPNPKVFKIQSQSRNLNQIPHNPKKFFESQSQK